MLTIEKKSLKVGRYVDTKHVDTVVRNYKQERWVYNSERLGKEDSLSSWYSVEELEDFLAHIKQYGADGVRIYYGVYPHDFAERPEYAGRQTVVLVATKRKHSEVGYHADKDIYIDGENGAQILAYNMSTQCPPTCPGNNPGGPDPDFGGIGITLVDRGDEGLTVV